jgi:hypothetical protein
MLTIFYPFGYMVAKNEMREVTKTTYKKFLTSLNIIVEYEIQDQKKSKINEDTIKKIANIFGYALGGIFSCFILSLIISFVGSEITSSYNNSTSKDYVIKSSHDFSLGKPIIIQKDLPFNPIVKQSERSFSITYGLASKSLCETLIKSILVDTFIDDYNGDWLIRPVFSSFLVNDNELIKFSYSSAIDVCSDSENTIVLSLDKNISKDVILNYVKNKNAMIQHNELLKFVENETKSAYKIISLFYVKDIISQIQTSSYKVKPEIMELEDGRIIEVLYSEISKKECGLLLREFFEEEINATHEGKIIPVSYTLNNKILFDQETIYSKRADIRSMSRGVNYIELCNEKNIIKLSSFKENGIFEDLLSDKDKQNEQGVSIKKEV